MKEIWKHIIGFEGIYQISNIGRVKSLERKVGHRLLKEKILSPTINNTKDGYLQINLSINKKRYPKLIHRLVAEAFIENPNNLPCINHKDENKINNNVDNLEWCDYKYNANYGTALIRSIQKKSRKIGQYSIDGELIAEFNSARDAERKTKFKQVLISKCCKGTIKHAYNFIWKYIE